MAYVGPKQRRQGVYCHEHWTTVGYPLLNSAYNYMVRDVFVEGTLTETYRASTNVEREVSYIFEVPPEASVVKFSATVGQAQVEAIVDEKNEADKKYRQAVNAGVQAWKLDKVNDEVFQISLGTVLPNSTMTVRVTYVYAISSDTLEDSARLTIPAGMAVRPGAPPAGQTTKAEAPTGTNAVTITVGIEVEDSAKILGLNSLSHLANITNGFSDASFKTMSPVEQTRASSNSKAYVEFTSASFLSGHFVLVWSVAKIDWARCIVEQLNPRIPGKPQTWAFALTLVSNVRLDPDEHEYLFVVDRSGSMYGSRSQAANDVVRTMLGKLPTVKKSTFNIYSFNTRAWSILQGSKTRAYDTANVNSAIVQLNAASVAGGTDINAALTTVLNERDTSKRQCSIIVVTDGLDWGVTAAMKTVQTHAANAAAKDNLLRVFVLGLGDDVSRGMCEALARAGSGATTYISQTQLQDQDHKVEKANTLIESITRAPIRVLSIDWGMNKASASSGGATGVNETSRPRTNQTELGAAAKGDNLPPPDAIQQAPSPGTMFWAVRSYWYAIINGSGWKGSSVKVKYDIPGVGASRSRQTIEVAFGLNSQGRLVHCLAARALIQTLEDKAVSITDSTQKYWNEAEIVRLGKTYGLASTQTSFVATMGGVGVRTNFTGSAPPAGPSLLSGVPVSNASDLGFVRTLAAPAAVAAAPPMMMNFAAFAPVSRMMQSATITDDPPTPAAAGDALADVMAAQDGSGAFDPDVVERSVFPSSSIPAVPAAIATLSGQDSVKNQVWLAICVIAFFQVNFGARSSEWAAAKAKAEQFAKTTLDCVFGIGSARAGEVYAKALVNAEPYID